MVPKHSVPKAQEGVNGVGRGSAVAAIEGKVGVTEAFPKAGEVVAGGCAFDSQEASGAGGGFGFIVEVAEAIDRQL